MSGHSKKSSKGQTSRDKPSEWSEWSEWEWNEQYGCLVSSREDSTGDVQWRYGQRQETIANESVPRFTPDPHSQHQLATQQANLQANPTSSRFEMQPRNLKASQLMNNSTSSYAYVPEPTAHVPLQSPYVQAFTTGPEYIPTLPQQPTNLITLTDNNSDNEVSRDISQLSVGEGGSDESEDTDAKAMGKKKPPLVPARPDPYPPRPPRPASIFHHQILTESSLS
jgi:hypothetical protein